MLWHAVIGCVDDVGVSIASPLVNAGYFIAVFKNGSIAACGVNVAGFTRGTKGESVVGTVLSLQADDYVEMYATEIRISPASCRKPR